jgi:hypothetical protein
MIRSADVRVGVVPAVDVSVTGVVFVESAEAVGAEESVSDPALVDCVDCEPGRARHPPPPVRARVATP